MSGTPEKDLAQANSSTPTGLLNQPKISNMLEEGQELPSAPEALLNKLKDFGHEQLDRIRNNWARCLLFFIFEGAFIALAAYLHKNTIPIHFSLPSYLARFDTTRLIKSLLIFAFNAWQGWALNFALNIHKDAYSEAASTSITSFVTLGLMKLLDRAGPGAIVVDNQKLTRPIPIGGLILGSSLLGRNFMTMEYVNKVPLGYVTQPNWIIPKPAYNAEQALGFVYNSDLIRFNYSCQWYAPNFTNVSPQDAPVIIGGKQFDFNSFKPAPNSSQLATTTFGTAVYPLLPLIFPPTDPSSAFLIFGGNSSIPLSSDPVTRNVPEVNVPGTRVSGSGNTIDLSNLPTVFNESWFNFSFDRFKASSGPNSLVFRAPLATALLCDPQVQLTSGTVNLTSNRLSVQSSDKTDRVHNINDSDVPTYFSYSMGGLASPDSDSFLNGRNDRGISTPLLVDITTLATSLLLSRTTVDANASIPPLPLDQINQNMNNFVLTVSKAQLVDAGQDNPGIQQLEILANSGISTLNVTGPTPIQVLAPSPVFFALTAFLAILIFGLCLYLTPRVNKTKIETETETEVQTDLPYQKVEQLASP